MTGAGMAAARLAAIQAIPGINITNLVELQNYLNADSGAIVAYIQASAVVNSGIPVTTTGGNGNTSATGSIS